MRWIFKCVFQHKIQWKLQINQRNPTHPLWQDVTQHDINVKWLAPLLGSAVTASSVVSFVPEEGENLSDELKHLVWWYWKLDVLVNEQNWILVSVQNVWSMYMFHPGIETRQLNIKMGGKTTPAKPYVCPVWPNQFFFSRYEYAGWSKIRFGNQNQHGAGVWRP